MPATAGTRTGIALIVIGVLAVADAYIGAIVGGLLAQWAPWMLVIGAAASSVGLFVLGAATRGALTRGVAILLTALFVVLVASFGTALTMPPDEGPGGHILHGLPVRLAIVFYGVGLLPLLALPIAFGLTFDSGQQSPPPKA